MADTELVALECPYCDQKQSRTLKREGLTVLTCGSAGVDTSGRPLIGCGLYFAVRLELIPVVEYYRIDRVVKEALDETG